ncbi:long chain acyl-CoA synthetase 4 isoform X3 [Physcomitrium patens]|nr:long chain acyl-CoA synthetase 4-like isoform X3 [Physcomitrium patens]|eukprot:XP_024370733.1 long chain acyl-CoA synthetase 4-like isoform X3 [Physcomitrella patens]
MRYVGVNPKGHCGIYGMNCPEWFTAMEACNAQSIVCVPLYDTLGLTAVEYILNHAEIEIAFAQETKLPLIMKSLPNCTTFLKTLVSFGAVTSDQRSKGQDAGVTIYAWQDFLDLGKKNKCDVTPPKKEDLSTIMYTSGTTGEPKGVMLTHENVVNTIAGLDWYLKSLNEVMNKDDVYFSFLPLAHIFDRVAEEMFVFIGGSIGFWQGDIKKVPEDIKELKPTLFVGVPRVFDRLTTGIQEKIAASGRIKNWLFQIGFSMKLFWLKKGYKQDQASPFFDKLVFDKVKMGLGGRVRLVISGAAPLSGHVEKFLRVIMCAPVMQGYGLTETCAASFLQVPDVISMNGTVGPPQPIIDVRLESVPELGYDALREDSPQGEICIRGKTLFSGYYKRPELTEEVLINGWFHTGDIGEWQKDGALKIIDRKKNIFKLSQGEYVAVENLENVYNESSSVDAIWVYGNSFESFLVAVAVPNQQALENWANSNGEEGDYATLCKSPKAQKFILSELTNMGKKKGLKGFEFIKAVHLDSQPFDVERDLTTPTFKLKRPQLLKYYQKEIDVMYNKIKSNS